jgi:transcriptional regulator with XRE-family HTH domain
MKSVRRSVFLRVRFPAGMSTYDIAIRLGISASTVQRILRDEGVQLRSPFEQHRPLPLGMDEQESVFVEPQTIEPQIIESQTVEASAAPGSGGSRFYGAREPERNNWFPVGEVQGAVC